MQCSVVFSDDLKLHCNTTTYIQSIIQITELKLF